jgi:hypothetical protein
VNGASGSSPLETAAVGVVGALTKENAAIQVSQWARRGCGLALVSFVCSIIIAGAIFANIPTSVQDMQPGEKIWDRRTYVVNRAICIMHGAGNLLFALFVVGVAAFASAIIALFPRRRQSLLLVANVREARALLIRKAVAIGFKTDSLERQMFGSFCALRQAAD